VPVEGVNWTLVEAKNKWLQLRDGDIYSMKYKWVGLKRLLIPYVYSYWVGDAYDTNSGIGVVKAKAENATPITPKRRIVRAYNAFVRMAGGDWVGWGWNRYSIADSLYGFINANSDLYPTYVFTPLARMNVLGI